MYLNASKQPSTVSYFIEQHAHENIIVDLTVGQILEYAFAFKNGYSSEMHNQMEGHISETMTTLMLPKDLLNRPFNSCSGGEQKRVAIAQELMALTPPNFLLIDEPTTGLDSEGALRVIMCLQRLAKEENISVIVSIHSPNNETLSLFDKIYVLAKGGTCIYSGPPNQLRAHLEHQLQLTLPKDQPPIEKIIQIACSGKFLNITKFIYIN